MNIYIRILGILSAVIVLIAATSLVFFLLDGGKKGIFLFIPIYILSHFLIANRFGFTYTEGSIKFGKTYLVLSLLPLLIILAIPIYFIFEEEKDKIHRQELENNFSELKNLGKESSAYGIEGLLIIKYSEGKMFWQLTAEKIKESNTKISVFKVELLDKDGFKLDEIEIEGFTVLTDDNDKTKGYQHNSSKYISIEEYSKIENWNLIIVANN
jgi:hypothetical protein